MRVRVGNLAREADFAVEAFEQAEIVGGLFGQEFESDGLAEGEVGGAVHFAHTAAAQQGNNAVPAGNQRAGNEPALFGARAVGGRSIAGTRPCEHRLN